MKHRSFLLLKDSDFKFLSRFDKFFFKHIGKCWIVLQVWSNDDFKNDFFPQSSFFRTLKPTSFFSLNDSDFESLHCHDLTIFLLKIMKFFIRQILAQKWQSNFFRSISKIWNFSTHIICCCYSVQCRVRLTLSLPTLAGWFNYWGRSSTENTESWPGNNSVVESALSKKQKQWKTQGRFTFQVAQCYRD